VINHHVLFVRIAFDYESTEGEFAKVRARLLVMLHGGDKCKLKI
jgi:hypothetical protein